MRVKVTKDDIDRGRSKAAKQCGCPLWYAFRRSFGLESIPCDEHLLKVADYYTVKLGTKIKVNLPEEAVELQKILVAAPNANPAPFEFDVKLQFT